MIKASVNTLLIIHAVLLGLAIIFFVAALYTRKESLTIDLEQETLAPLYPLHILNTLRPPTKPTTKPPEIIYYHDPTTKTTTKASTVSNANSQISSSPKITFSSYSTTLDNLELDKTSTVMGLFINHVD